MSALPSGYSVGMTRSLASHAASLHRGRRRVSYSMPLLLIAFLFTFVPRIAAQDYPNPPKALSQWATDDDFDYSPILDYDTDGCYNVPAVGFDDNNNIVFSEGLPTDSGDHQHCHDISDLDNTNAYSRQRCNTGWCAYMYTYYFEKDTELPGGNGGHRHDIEHIVVWVEQVDKIPKWVSSSLHTSWRVTHRDNIYWDGNHPKMVYNKDQGSIPIAHQFRPANADDNAYQENDYHTWRSPPLISWNGYPEGVREALIHHDFGAASFPLSDDVFSGKLQGARPTYAAWGCTPDETTPAGWCDQWDFDWDPSQDDNSPGTPRYRFMILGDSMTQGREGDWTWRYRLWKWFESNHLDMVHFVGPYVGTRDADQPGAPSRPPVDGESRPEGSLRVNGKYATDKLWRRAHKAIWGRQLAQEVPEVQHDVESHDPDYILIMLGFNDIGWFITDVQGTLTNMKSLIDNARAQKSTVRFAIADIPQRTSLGEVNPKLSEKTTDYNNQLAEKISSWSTAESRIELVKLSENYDCHPEGCPAGYDGLHPNAKGEFQIASAFTKTLYEKYRIGTSALSIPRDSDIPPRSCPVPNNVKAQGSDLGVTVTWDAQFGVYGYDVRYRLKGWEWEAGNLASAVVGAGANRYDTTWTKSGMEWEYQVRSSIGNLQSDWSATVSAIAAPKTPNSPSQIGVYATGINAIRVEWTDAGSNADLYVVMVWDKDTPGAWIGYHATNDLQYHYKDSIIADHRYDVFVQAWNSYGGGWPGVGRSVYPGSLVTPAPRNLVVETLDAVSVMLHWDASNSFTTSYRTWVRRIDDGSPPVQDDGGTITTSKGIGFLFPGVWHFEFCVTALNGDAESVMSKCIIPPKLDGW